MVFHAQFIVHSLITICVREWGETSSTISLLFIQTNGYLVWSRTLLYLLVAAVKSGRLSSNEE